MSFIQKLARSRNMDCHSKQLQSEAAVWNRTLLLRRFISSAFSNSSHTGRRFPRCDAKCTTLGMVPNDALDVRLLIVWMTMSIVRLNQIRQFTLNVIQIYAFSVGHITHRRVLVDTCWYDVMYSWILWSLELWSSSLWVALTSRRTKRPTRVRSTDVLAQCSHVPCWHQSIRATFD